MTIRLLTLIVVVFAQQTLYAQSEIYLQSRNQQGRIKNLNPKRQFTVYSKDSIYKHIQLGPVNDSTLGLIGQETGSIHHINVKDILSLEREPKSGFFEVIAYSGMILLSVTPVVWLFEGGEEAKGTLQGAGLLASISIPFILIKNVGKRKDTVRDWDIKVRSQD